MSQQQQTVVLLGHGVSGGFDAGGVGDAKNGGADDKHVDSARRSDNASVGGGGDSGSFQPLYLEDENDVSGLQDGSALRVFHQGSPLCFDLDHFVHKQASIHVRTNCRASRCRLLAHFAPSKLN